MGSPGLPHSSRALQVSMRLEKPLCPVSQRFSNIRPIGDGALSFFHGRSPSASFSHFFSSKRSMALYLWPCARIYCFKLLNTSDLPRSHVRVALPASLSARSFFFTSACPGQSTQEASRWMSTTDTCQPGLPVPLFKFCSKLIECERRMACVVKRST